MHRNVYVELSGGMRKGCDVRRERLGCTARHAGRQEVNHPLLLANGVHHMHAAAGLDAVANTTAAVRAAAGEVEPSSLTACLLVLVLHATT